MADPFDVTNSDSGGDGGVFGVSPDAWRNLMAFGAATTVAANARDGRGFLTYGTGALGPLGAGALGAMDTSRTNAQSRSDMARSAATRGYLNAQTQGQQIQNQIGAMTLPFARAKAGMQMQMLDGLTGGAPSPGVTVGPQSNAAPAAGSNAALNVPPEYMPYYQAASARTGIPVDVLLAQHKQESNFNPNAIGRKGEIGLGQILPSTAANPGYGMQGVDPATLKDPATNINFSADYLKARAAPGTNFADPSQRNAAFLSYNGGGDPNYVQNVSRYLPAGSPPTAGQPYQVAGNNPVAPPQGGAPASPSPASPQSGIGPQGQLPPQLAAIKAQADGLMARANQLEFVGLPGADILKAQAQNLYKVLADTTTNVLKPRDVRQGAIDINPVNGQVTAAPQQATRQAPNGAKESFVLDPLTGAQVPGTMTHQTSIPLADETNLKERGSGWAKREGEINDQAVNAVGTNNTLDNMRAAAQHIDLGAGAATLQAANTWLLSLGKSLGVDMTGLQDKVANTEDLNKNSVAMVSAATKAVSPRASQQEMQFIAKSQLSNEMSRGGFNMIADQMQGVNDFTIARAQALQDYINGNEKSGIKPHGNSGGFDVWFNQQVTPAAFTLQRMTQTPEGQQRTKALIADLQKTPEGQQALKGMFKHVESAQKLGLFGPPPGGSAQ